MILFVHRGTIAHHAVNGKPEKQQRGDNRKP
jgi:hypothetical protein